MDAADRAVDGQERLDARNLKARPTLRRRTDGGIHCLECREEIPTARRDAIPDCLFCVDCQDMIDRRRAA